MTLEKRKLESLHELDDNEFDVIRKVSLINTETCDSSSKEDLALSPVGFKPQFSEHLQSPDHHDAATPDKAVHSKVGEGSRRKNRSGQMDSYEELRQAYASDPSSYIDTFKVLKYRNYRYRLNTCMLIRNEADADNDFVCKLIKIIKPKKKDEKGVLAFLQVQWYYRKEDLPKKFSSYFPHLGWNEVFLSTHTDFIMVDCINGPCQILTYDEYDKVETYSASILYTRASYDVAKRKMEPPFEKWPKVCLCNNPQNPDQVYIQCDSCNNWFHLHCAGVSVEEANAIDKYFCKICKDPQSALEHRTKLGRRKSSCKQLTKSNSVNSPSKAQASAFQTNTTSAVFFPDHKNPFYTGDQSDAIDSQDTLSSYKNMDGCRLDFEGSTKVNLDVIAESKFGGEQNLRGMNNQRGTNFGAGNHYNEGILRGFGTQIFVDDFSMNFDDNMNADFL